MNAIIWLVWATAATTKVAHARRVLLSIVIVVCVVLIARRKKRGEGGIKDKYFVEEVMSGKSEQTDGIIMYIVVAIATTTYVRNGIVGWKTEEDLGEEGDCGWLAWGKLQGTASALV